MHECAIRNHECQNGQYISPFVKEELPKLHLIGVTETAVHNGKKLCACVYYVCDNHQ